MKSYFKDRWKELPISDVDTTKFYKYKRPCLITLFCSKAKPIIDKDLEEFKKKYDVWINYDLLNKLQLNDTNKSNETYIGLVIKSFTGEFLVPTVDTKWLYY